MLDEPGGRVPASWELTIRVQAGERLSLEQIRAFLEASETVGFQGRNREEVYAFVYRTLRQQRYQELKRSGRGLVRRYISKMTGLSRAQTTRLLTMYLKGEEVKPKPYRRHRFQQRYQQEDIELLAAVDSAHATLSGPATQKILYRACHDFGEQKYERLARLSVAQLYRLRKSRRYRELRVAYQPTRPTQVSIGERRRPDPQGRPGYLPVDTVHQGDQDGAKGVYHINAVDEVTQWQVVGATAQISEAHLLPVLEAMLQQFPFRVLGFHSDNESEYINRRVAEMLPKLHAEFTKSRACRSQDNALVEGKNGAVIRKLIGYGHIAGLHAAALQNFYVEHLNPYLNFHRPCGFATVSLDKRGKRQRKYKIEDYRTPLEKLQSLPEA